MRAHVHDFWHEASAPPLPHYFSANSAPWCDQCKDISKLHCLDVPCKLLRSQLHNDLIYVRIESPQR